MSLAFHAKQMSNMTTDAKKSTDSDVLIATKIICTNVQHNCRYKQIHLQ